MERSEAIVLEVPAKKENLNAYQDQKAHALGKKGRKSAASKET